MKEMRWHTLREYGMIGTVTYAENDSRIPTLGSPTTGNPQMIVSKCYVTTLKELSTFVIFEDP